MDTDETLLKCVPNKRHFFRIWKYDYYENNMFSCTCKEYRFDVREIMKGDRLKIPFGQGQVYQLGK